MAAIPTQSSSSVAAYAFAFLTVGAMLIGLALVPVSVVPWYGASRALERRRGDLALFGALGLLAAAFFLFQAT